MLIESGPNAERKVRSTLLFLLVAIFAVWYAYDGWVGYEKNNVREFLKTLPADQRPPSGHIPIYTSVNEENIERVKELRLGAHDDPEAAIGTIFGGSPSLKTPDAWYYVGQGHWFRFAVQNNRPTGELKVERLQHTATDIRWQKNFAYGLAVLSAAALFYVIRVRMARARLDDSGLSLNGGPVITWDSMKRLDTERFRAKGWVDLYHGDPEEPTRIDEYHFKVFDEIIEAVCARKGFENPLIKLNAATGNGGDAAEQTEA